MDYWEAWLLGEKQVMGLCLVSFSVPYCYGLVASWIQWTKQSTILPSRPPLYPTSTQVHSHGARLNPLKLESEWLLPPLSNLLQTSCHSTAPVSIQNMENVFMGNLWFHSLRAINTALSSQSPVPCAVRVYKPPSVGHNSWSPLSIPSFYLSTWHNPCLLQRYISG